MLFRLKRLYRSNRYVELTVRTRIDPPNYARYKVPLEVTAKGMNIFTKYNPAAQLVSDHQQPHTYHIQDDTFKDMLKPDIRILLELGWKTENGIYWYI